MIQMKCNINELKCDNYNKNNFKNYIGRLNRLSKKQKTLKTNNNKFQQFNEQYFLSELVTHKIISTFFDDICLLNNIFQKN